MGLNSIQRVFKIVQTKEKIRKNALGKAWQPAVDAFQGRAGRLQKGFRIY